MARTKKTARMSTLSDVARRQDETTVMEQQPAAAAAATATATAAAGGILSNKNEPISEITIVVRETSGEECFFKVKQTRAMRKVFEVFATCKGVDRSTLIFSLEDGTEIPDHETPRGIGLGNDGRINVLSLRQWVQNELDAFRRQFHDHLQEQLDRLQEQLDSLQQKFMAASIKRDADDSNETENDAKRRRSK